MGPIGKGVPLYRRCFERGWRSWRVGDELYLYEERANHLIRIADSVADSVVASAGESLRECVADAGTTTHPALVQDAEWVVALTLLGVRVDVYCEHLACAHGIAAYYSAVHEPAPAASPEVVVRCARPVADRALFRARDASDEGAPLPGVTVAVLGGSPAPWTSQHQPLPPLDVWPFRDRFIALHAAAVRSPSGDGVLLAGDRGTGKTTAALSLAVDHGAALLADETAVIGCRTKVIQPFPHSVGVWEGAEKLQVPVTDVCPSVWLEAVPATRLVFLDRHEAREGVRRVSPEDALRHLLRHHRHAGAADGDAMTTLFALASGLDAWMVSYRRHDALGELVAGLLP